MTSLRFSVAAWLGLAALVLSAAPRAAADGQRADAVPGFNLTEVLDGSYSASGLGATWVTANNLARRTSEGIQLYNATTKTFHPLVPNSALVSLSSNIGSWTLSEDLNKLLCSYDVKTGFRHSTEAKYAVWGISERKWQILHSGEHLQTALLAPSGNGTAYVYENNIYYVKDILASNNGERLTDDGSKYIYNGVPDWVYEEEVLSSGSALWFSPNGSHLAFAKFDDNKVEEFSYITYGYEEYTKVETLLYPKPGKDNPTVTVTVCRLEDKESVVLDDVSTNLNQPILQNVHWASNDKIIVLWLNRIQNSLVISSYTSDGRTKPNWSHQEVFKDSVSNGWLDVGAPRAVNSTTWVMLLPRPLATYGNQRFTRPTIIKDGNPIDIVTTNLTATSLYGWNASTRRIFFQAAPSGQPGQRHVYAVNDNGNGALQCLTCGFTQPYNNGSTACLYASAAFSVDFSFAAFTCAGPGPAAVHLAKVKDDGNVEYFPSYWEENQALLTKLAQRRLPTVEGNITVSVADGFTAVARLWLPPNLDRSKKYPMLVYVYGGPGSQQVSEAFSINWGTYLATSLNIIYALIDGRGSGFQGTKNLYALYKKLGTVEVEDQIAVTKHLLEKYPFIDSDRVGIWGWSYGGYATAMAMSKDSDRVFACGASVAPVTSWRLYDSIYTERYMDIPDANTDGYAKANISNKLENFKKHEFYLLHGNADDNVHYQNAMRLARALEENNIFFESQSYPDENHSIRSVVTHVYSSLTVFFERCFEEEENGAVSLLPALIPAFVFPLLARLLA